MSALVGRWTAGLVVACVLGLLTAATLGCGGGTIKQVRGAKFELSGRETKLADEYQQTEPKTATEPERCDYWKGRVNDARGGHKIGALKWPAEYFETLREWVGAKRDAACSLAEKEEKREKEVKEADHAKQRQEMAEQSREAEEKAAAKAQVTTAKEIETGRCSDERYQRLQQVMHVMKQVLEDDFHLVGHDVVVATKEGTAVDPSAWLGGELHLFAIGFHRLRLDVRDKRDYEIKITSMYEGAASSVSGGATDSRVVQVGATDEVKTRVMGAGCVLVLAMRKY